MLSVSQKKEKISAAIRTTWKKIPRTLASLAIFENVLGFTFIFDRSNLIYSKSENGDKAVVDGAKIMAMTVVDLWANKKSMESAQTEFELALQNI